MVYLVMDLVHHTLLPSHQITQKRKSHLKTYSRERLSGIDLGLLLAKFCYKSTELTRWSITRSVLGQRLLVVYAKNTACGIYWLTA